MNEYLICWRLVVELLEERQVEEETDVSAYS